MVLSAAKDVAQASHRTWKRKSSRVAKAHVLLQQVIAEQEFTREIGSLKSKPFHDGKPKS